MLVIANGGMHSGAAWLYQILHGLSGFAPLPTAYLDQRSTEIPLLHPPQLLPMIGGVDLGAADYLVQGRLADREATRAVLRHPAIRVVNITRDICDVVTLSWNDPDEGSGYRDFAHYAQVRGHRNVRATMLHRAAWALEHDHVHQLHYDDLLDRFDETVHEMARFLGLAEPVDEHGPRIDTTSSAIGPDPDKAAPWTDELVESVRRKESQWPTPHHPIPSSPDPWPVNDWTFAPISAGQLVTDQRPVGISVVVPVLNQVDYIAETLDSILDQRYPNLELIVIDGGSTDGTADIIESYDQHIDYWISEPDSGHADAINKGFARSNAEIMGWLNGGDLFHPGGLSIVGEIFEDYPEVEWLQGRPNTFDEKGRTIEVSGTQAVWGLMDYVRWNVIEGHIQQEATYWRRRLWERAGSRLATEYKLAVDVELWIRFFQYSTVQNVSALIGGFRLHDDQRSHTQRQAFDDEGFAKVAEIRDERGYSEDDCIDLWRDQQVLSPLNYRREIKGYAREYLDVYHAQTYPRNLQRIEQRVRLARDLALTRHDLIISREETRKAREMLHDSQDYQHMRKIGDDMRRMREELKNVRAENADYADRLRRGRESHEALRNRLADLQMKRGIAADATGDDPYAE